MKSLSLLIGACLLATLCNPYGWRLYPWVLRLLGDPYFMDLNLEWKAVDFRSGGAFRYELLLLLFVALLAVSDRRPTLVEILFALGWLHLALTGFRYVALWVVVVVPLLCRLSLGVRIPEGWVVDSGPGSLFHTRSGYGSSLWLLPFSGVLFLLAFLNQGRHVRHNPEIVPTEAVDAFVGYAREWAGLHGRRPRLFHAYDWGGRVTWKGWPELKNWIDDRNEAQGEKRCKRAFATMKAETGWEETMDEIDLALVYPDSALAGHLRHSGQWAAVREDAHAVLFARRRVLPERNRNR